MKGGGHGAAVDECYEEEGTYELWVSNGEYANEVKFCPFCGYKSKAAIKTD